MFVCKSFLYGLVILVIIGRQVNTNGRDLLSTVPYCIVVCPSEDNFTCLLLFNADF